MLDMPTITYYKGIKLDPEKSRKMPENIDPYIPGKNLVDAVKLAQYLGRPLLVKGEPGCGKTRLAQAVAYELFEDRMEDFYFEWHVKSNSKAQDGLYVIDHLKRLRNANRTADNTSLDIKLEPGKTKGEYLELGPLGKAFRITNEISTDSPPPVVLIDEIDKADIDFPNDLLLELDQMKFEIPESKDESGNPIIIEANKSKKPLIIITSNDEKQLPAAFLRRCLFFYIEYPHTAMLQQIVMAKFPKLKKELAEDASVLFTSLRGEIVNAGTATKNISTSEFLDWVNIIANYHEGELDLNTVPYEQTLAKDNETLQIINKFIESKKSITTKDKASEPTLAS
jgi:MoxR-like ATPase